MDWSITLFAWFVVFARAGATLLTLPFTGATVVPIPVRLAIAASLAMLVAPNLPNLTELTSSVGSLITLFALEISVGLLLGFLCKLIFLTADLAGSIIALEMGLSLSSEFNPLQHSTAPTPSIILHWLGLMILFGLDLHHWILAAFTKSYTYLPVGAARLSENLLTEMIGRTGDLFMTAVQMTSPIIAVAFVITLGFSLLARAVPQINAFAESFPAKIMAGLIVFGISCELSAQFLARNLRRLPEDMLRVAQQLGG